MQTKDTLLNSKWFILSILTFSEIINGIAVFALPPLAPFFQPELKFSLAQIGLISTAVFMGLGISSPIMGWLTDIIGIKRVLLFAHIISGIFLVGVSRINDLSSGIFFMFFAGAGISAITPCTTKAVMSWFQAKGRATIVGIVRTGFTLGGVIAASLLPILALSAGWRNTLILTGAIIGLSGVIPFFFYKDPKDVVNIGVDKVSFSLDKFRKILSNRNFRIISLSGAFFGAIQYSVTSYLILYLKEIIFLSVVIAGASLAVAQAGGGAGRIILGLISDGIFYGRRKIVVVLISLLSCLMFIVISIISTGFPVLLILILSFILGISTLGYAALFVTFRAEIVGKELAGTGSGLGSAIVSIGILLGPPLFGFIVDITDSYSAGWLLLFVFQCIAIFLISKIKEGAVGKST